MISDSELAQALLSESDILQRAADTRGVELKDDHTTGALGFYDLDARFLAQMETENIHISAGLPVFSPVTFSDTALIRVPDLPSYVQPRAGFRIVDMGSVKPAQNIAGVAIVPLTKLFGDTRFRWSGPDLPMPGRAEVLFLKALIRIRRDPHPLLVELAEAEGFVFVSWEELGYDPLVSVRELFNRKFAKREVRDIAASDVSPFFPEPYSDESPRLYVPARCHRDLFRRWDRQLGAYRSLQSKNRPKTK